MLNEEAAGKAEKEGQDFVEEGIDQILSGRTEKRQIGGRAGNSFSVATFAAAEVRSNRSHPILQPLHPLSG